MDYNNITSVYNEKYQKQAAKVFRDAIAQAVKLCDADNPFISITTVSKGTEDTWDNGEICLKGDGHNLGVIYHEVFHSVYHGSPIWKFDDKNVDPRWGEAFCDAFRYLMHKKYKAIGAEDKNFMAEFRKCPKKKDADVTAQDSYKELGSRIIKHLAPSPSLNKYRSLWKLLNEKAKNTGFSIYGFFGLDHITP